MAAAEPESKPASERALKEAGGPPAPSPAATAEIPDAGEPPKSSAEAARVFAAPAPRALPERLRVNSGAAATSNSKELRAREAEEDRALIAKAQTGDTAAFRSLVERHQRRAFAIAFSLVRDEHDARELVQDAFLRVFKGLATFKGGSSFFTWLYRIVTNLSIDLMRKPGRALAGGFTLVGDVEGKGGNDNLGPENESENIDFPLLSRIDGSDPADVLRRREIASRIQAALDALPVYHRSVIVMREVEGLSYDEMASVMGVSKGTIMSRLFHARQKLQKALHDCYEEQVGAVKVGGGDGGDASESAAPEADGPASENATHEDDASLPGDES